MSSSQKKQDYAKRFRGYLQKYTKALLVHCDNVGSKQFQDIRKVRKGGPRSARKNYLATSILSPVDTHACISGLTNHASSAPISTSCPPS